LYTGIIIEKYIASFGFGFISIFVKDNSTIFMLYWKILVNKKPQIQRNFIKTSEFVANNYYIYL